MGTRRLLLDDEVNPNCCLGSYWVKLAGKFMLASRGTEAYIDVVQEFRANCEKIPH